MEDEDNLHNDKELDFEFYSKPEKGVQTDAEDSSGLKNMLRDSDS